MPGIGYDGAAEAARRAAEEAARRERKRRELRAKIKKWEGKLSEVTGQIDGLRVQEIHLEECLGEWETEKGKYMGSEILSEVVIRNLSEGWYAEDIKEELSICMAEMDKTYKGVGGLKDNVGAQIARLNEYRSVINDKLTSLNNELRAI